MRWSLGTWQRSSSSNASAQVRCQERGLTLRSSQGPPPAWHLAREAPGLSIRLAGQAPCRFRPLSSNVRPHKQRPSLPQIPVHFIDQSLFLTTFGREVCAALAVLPNFDPEEAPSAHDCYSVFTDTLGFPPSLDALSALRAHHFQSLAAGFNEYFETTSVTAESMEQACAAVAAHWKA
jgi:hypothetical protein